MIAITLAKPKLKIKNMSISTYWLIPLIGALCLLAFQLISVGEAFDGLTFDAAINPIKILVLFLSMTILSVFLDETGFFKYLANAVLRKTSSSQIKLFTALYVTVSLVTIFTSNDIVILTFTPFVYYFTKNAKINPIPYLVSCFVAANTCSMLLIIGNPTNIYLATASGIDFFGYLKVMALPTFFAALTAYIVMFLIFKKALKKQISGVSGKVAIVQKPLLVVALGLLAIGTIFLAISSYIHTEMWLIAISTAGLLFLIVLTYALIKRTSPKELGRTLKRAPWELIPFVISMFILVLALEKYDVTMKLGSMLGTQNTIFTYGVVSALFANLVNNIPMSVLFSTILHNSGIGASGVYATIIGSNIGAFLTPAGALAGIMWLSILKKNGLDFSFFRFLKHGIVIAIPVLAASLASLAISSMWA